jgi:hypothetical protein
MQLLEVITGRLPLHIMLIIFGRVDKTALNMAIKQDLKISLAT